MCGIWRKVALLLLLAAVAESRGPLLSEVQTNGSLFMTLDDVDAVRSYTSFIPANPEFHSFDDDGFIRVRNLTLLLDQATTTGITSSYEAGKWWIADGRNRLLSEMDITSSRDRILRRRINNIFSLAYDSVNEILYWAQKVQYRTIGAMDAEGNRFVTIARFQSVDPHDIAIHLTKRKMFFSVMDLPSRRFTATQLVKSDLDGQNMVSVLRYPFVIIIQGLAIDYEDDRIYWTDLNIATGSFAVSSSDFSGQNRRLIFSLPNTNLWGVGVVNGYVYAANVLNNSRNEHSIYVSKKEGGNVTSLKLRFRPQYLSVYAPSEPDASKIPRECQGNRCDHLCVASQAGNYSCKCSDGYRLVDGHICDTVEIDDKYLIVADIGQEGVFKLPLNEAERVNAYAVDMGVSTKKRIYAMEVDAKTGDLIFYKEDFGDSRIIWGDRSIPFDGDVGSITKHCCRDIIFWNTQENIYSWDGKANTYTVLNYTFDFFILVGILQLEVDCVADHLYWREFSSFLEKGSVKRSDLHGDNVEVVLENLPPTTGMTIDYETYTLHVVNTITFEVYSLPLPLNDITNTSAYQPQYNATSFSSILLQELLPFVKNIAVMNGTAYVVGMQGIRKFTLGPQRAQLERFGPNIFHNVPTVRFYDRNHYEAFIKPICQGSSSPTQVTNQEKDSDDDCIDLLKRALSATDDYVLLLDSYLKCVIKALIAIQ